MEYKFPTEADLEKYNRIMENLNDIIDKELPANDPIKVSISFGMLTSMAIARLHFMPKPIRDAALEGLKLQLLDYSRLDSVLGDSLVPYPEVDIKKGS